MLRPAPRSGERRNHLVHPKHAVPEVHATRPNQLWSWDISKLHGPARWTYYYLYVIRLELLTPADVHHGRAQERLAARNQVLAAAFAAHPERFPRGPPSPGQLPHEVWINKPVQPEEATL